MGWLISAILSLGKIAGFLNKLCAFIKERQLRADERNKIKVEQNDADNEARKATKEIVKNNANLSPDDVRERLRKYRRKT